MDESTEPQTVDEIVEAIRAEVDLSGGTITSGGTRHAVVDAFEGTVVNVVMYNPAHEYLPGTGLTLVALDADSNIGIGDTLDAHGKLVKKAEPALFTTDEAASS